MSKTLVYSSYILPSFSYMIICLVFTNQYSCLVVSQSSPSELEILLRIKKEWGNQHALEWWNDATSPCSWPGIRCSGGGTVTGISLRSRSITSQIPSSICDLKSLSLLDLGNNTIGGEFPTVLYNCANLQILDLSHNLFAGKLPDDIDKLSPNNLQHLNLDTNYFSGEIPQGLWTLPRILTLILSNNYLAGQLPGQVASRMTQLKINNNKLSGEIPPTVGTNWGNLEVFEASDNSLSGSIPLQLTSLSRIQIVNLDGNNLSGELPSRIISWTKLNTLKLSRNQLSGSIPSALASLPALNLLDLSKNQLSGQIPHELGLVYHFSLNLSSNKLTGRIPYWYDSAAYRASFQDTSLCSETGALDIPRCSILQKNARTLPLKFLVSAIVVGVVATLGSVFFSWSMILGLQRRKHTQLEDLTSYQLTTFQKLDFTKRGILNNLADTNPIGFGGSGNVYRIPINGSGGVVAVKKISNTKKASNEKQFQAEVEILSKIKHINIVKLLCCISSDDLKLLVYEYMENRSLDRWIHKGKQRPISSSLGHRLVRSGVLDWPTRLRIAAGAAQGLNYMHNDCSPPIIHRDVKSTNILLDSEFNAKIGDFGLAKLFTKSGREAQKVSAVVGTFGYMDPEYQPMIKVSLLSDVYSFGVVLLELVTGKGPREGDEEYSNLADWARKHCTQEHPITDVLDVEVKKDCYLQEMTHVLRLGLSCTNILPSSRPSMKEVSDELRMLLDNHMRPRMHGYHEHDSAPLLQVRTYISSCDSNREAIMQEEIVEEEIVEEHD